MRVSDSLKTDVLIIGAGAAGIRAAMAAAEAGAEVYWRGEGALPERVEVAHFSHAFNGGVKIDEKFVSTFHQVIFTKLVAEAALRRMESLGSHYRSDSRAPYRHPDRHGLPDDATTPSPGISGGMVHENRF